MIGSKIKGYNWLKNGLSLIKQIVYISALTRDWPPTKQTNKIID